jgi:hypothetical protein
MIELRPNLHKQPPFIGIKNNPIPRQPLFEQFNLKPHKPVGLNR